MKLKEATMFSKGEDDLQSKSSPVILTERSRSADAKDQVGLKINVQYTWLLLLNWRGDAILYLKWSHSKSLISSILQNGTFNKSGQSPIFVKWK